MGTVSLPRCFLGIDSSVFCNFCMVLETDMKLCVTTRFFSKISFAVKMGKMGQKKKPKQGFFNLLEDLIINFF